MKIDNRYNNPISIANQEASAENRAQAARQQNQGAQPQAAQPEAAKQDSVHLSDRARMVARAQEIVSQTPEVRTEKVEELRNQINAGTYNVSGREVADSMLKKGFNGLV